MAAVGRTQDFLPFFLAFCGKGEKKKMLPAVSATRSASPLLALCISFEAFLVRVPVLLAALRTNEGSMLKGGVNSVDIWTFSSS